MHDQPQYDALVVGAGPGGATAATFMARAGLKVLLVDKAVFPRDKVCGDALSGKTVDVLQRLGLIDTVEAAPNLVAWGITFSSPYGAEVDVQFRDPATATMHPGYVVAREEFDGLVVDAAKAAGAEVWENVAVTGLVRDGARVTGATLKREGVEQTVTARVVIGADGAYSVVARALGFEQLDERHYCAGLRQYWEGITNFHEHNLIELHFVDEAIPGYFWIFPMANNRANVGIGMLSSEIKKRDINLKQLLQRCIEHPQFAERFKDARPLEKMRGYGLPLGSRPRPLSGEGWMLVGDAASLIDPFSGEGIGNAMISGEFAAKHAVLALQGAPCRRRWRAGHGGRAGRGHGGAPLGLRPRRDGLPRRRVAALAHHAEARPLEVAAPLRDFERRPQAPHPQGPLDDVRGRKGPRAAQEPALLPPRALFVMLLPAPRALLFDMDGVVVDTEPIHEEALQRLYAAHGWPLEDPKFYSFKGRTPSEVFGELEAQHGRPADEIAAEKHAHFEALFEGKAALVPGVTAFLALAAARGLPAVLVTSGRRSEVARVFARFGLASAFAGVVAAEDVTRSKPHPEPYLKGAEIAGVPPEACLVLEDTLHGARAGLAAGCTVAAYTGTFPVAALRSAGVHATFDTFEALAGMLGWA